MRIAVDWGSSSFRAYLLDEQLNCVDKISNANGVFSLKSSFADTLQEACGEWLRENGVEEVLLAGMAGSRNGWLETGYSQCPVSAGQHRQAALDITNRLRIRITVLPGVQALSPSGFPDVMRGEEVQIFGALEISQSKEAFICLPGTHSKWVELQDGNIKSFATLMTGELFALVSEYSSIGALVTDTDFDKKSFLTGVRDQRQGSNLLNSKVGLTHSLFSVRARTVSNSLEATSVFSYLSGLLLADEIASVQNLFDLKKQVVLISDEKLSQPYQIALDSFGLQVKLIDSEEAFLQGIKLLI